MQFHLKEYRQPGLYWVLTGEKEALLFDLLNSKSLLCLSNSIKYTSFFQVAIAIVAHRVVKEVYQSNLNEVGLLFNNIDAFYLRYISVLLLANRKKQMSLGMSVYDYKRFIKLYDNFVVARFENNSHVHIALDKSLTSNINYFSQARIGDINRKPKTKDLDLNFVSVIQDIDKIAT